MTKENNAEILFSLFKQIEDYISNIVNENGNFNELVSKACKIMPHIKEYGPELNDLSLIRTLIAHKNRDHLILIPEETINRAKEILNYIRNPPTVFDIFEKEVYFCNSNDLLIEVLRVMKEKTFTHVPVYSNKGFIGILSEASIANWLSDSKELNMQNIKVKELNNFLNNQPNEYFDFVNKNEDAYKIKERFLNEVKGHKRIGSIFITQNGKNDEKLLGVITAWDLPLLKMKRDEK